MGFRYLYEYRLHMLVMLDRHFVCFLESIAAKHRGRYEARQKPPALIIRDIAARRTQCATFIIIESLLGFVIADDARSYSQRYFDGPYTLPIAFDSDDDYAGCETMDEHFIYIITCRRAHHTSTASSKPRADRGHGMPMPYFPTTTNFFIFATLRRERIDVCALRALPSYHCRAILKRAVSAAMIVQ